MVIFGINEIISLFACMLLKYGDGINLFFFFYWNPFVCLFVLLFYIIGSGFRILAGSVLYCSSDWVSVPPLQHGLDENALQSGEVIMMAYAALHTGNPVGVILAHQRDKCMPITKGSAICSIYITAWSLVKYRILASANNQIQKESTLSHHGALLQCNPLPLSFTLPTHSQILPTEFPIGEKNKKLQSWYLVRSEAAVRLQLTFLKVSIQYIHHCNLL